VRLDIDTILSEYFPPPEDADIWTPEKGRPSFELYKYADNEREVPREVLRSQLVTCRYCAQILAACHGIEGVVALCKVLVDALQPQPESDPE
jgi:hypothetical protein